MSTYPRVTEAVNHPLLPNITNTRLDKFLGGHYASQNLSSVLDRGRVDGDEYVKMTVWSAPGTSKPDFKEATQQLVSTSKPYRKGDKLGPSWTNHWLHVQMTIPKSFAGKDTVIFEFDPGCEAMIFTPEGHALHAITGGPNSSKDGKPGTQEDRRVEHIIPAAAVKSGKYECYIEVSVNSIFGLGLGGFRHQAPDMNVYYELITADIVCLNSNAHALKTDFQILTQMARAPDAAISNVSRRALKACNDIMNTFRRVDGDEDLIDKLVTECRDIAQAVLGPLDEESIKGLATHNPDFCPEAKIWAIGHCHIDTAWLWRYTQTQQKIARSWATQCDLMDRYPNYIFAASSAQQYVWLNELYPSVFERVKHYVKEKRFLPVGGAWLEHDCMIPSGESFARQYLYGQRYFEEEFGVRSREAWLPDTFGYASQLPQVLRLSGIDYFFTQKLSWNNINVFPYSTFNWCGIDGTQVLAHMTPVDSYNAQANYDELLKGTRNHKNLGVTDEALLLFGNGDGGGGPTPLMLEKLQRLSAVSKENPEVPGVKVGRPADFFEMIRSNTKNGSMLPTWRGELYFELHRGTYTSQAEIKKGNKTMERLLRDLEYFATLASLQDSSYKYPKAELDEIWKDIMLNQFHDVLPGTSIRLANEDVWDIYNRRIAQTKALIENVLSHALPSSTSGTPTVIDSLRLSRAQVLDVTSLDLTSSDIATTGDKKYAFIKSEGGLGSIVNSKGLEAPKAWAEKDSFHLSNAHYKLTISKGRITSLIDVPLNRELILPGPGAETGGLMLYEDFPLAYDAWDAEIFHLDNYRVLDFNEVEVENGPLRSVLKATAKFGKSVVVLRFALDAVYPDAPTRSWLQVDVHADWWEKHKFLKFALPVDIHSPYATYGTQFGLIDRPTHRNTTQEQAKFEVCAHMFGDVSEAGYGIAVASDYKYGYAVEGNSMRLSLLRSSTAPDANQDEGEHDFSFAVMPHVGRLHESGVYQEALKYTNDVYVRPTEGKTNLLNSVQFLVEGAPSVVLETVKRGEDDFGKKGSKTIVLRMYESLGGRTRGSLKLNGIKPKSLVWTDLLEEPMPGDEAKVSSAEVAGSTEVALNFRGFEIKTLLITL